MSETLEIYDLKTVKRNDKLETNNRLQRLKIKAKMKKEIYRLMQIKGQKFIDNDDSGSIKLQESG